MLITSGVSGGILLSLMAVLNPGDEVIIGDPYFVIYKHAVKLVGGKPVLGGHLPRFPLPRRALRGGHHPADQGAWCWPRPSNPTGVVLTEAELRQAAELAERHNIMLLMDEIYNQLAYDGPVPPALKHAPHRTLLLRGFGKSYGMTGWRLGYAAGPKFLIEEMTKLQQYTFVCRPSMVQYAGLAALDTDITGHVDDYRRKRDLVWNASRPRSSGQTRRRVLHLPEGARPVRQRHRVRRQGHRAQRADHPRQRLQRARHPLPHQLRDREREARARLRDPLRPGPRLNYCCRGIFAVFHALEQ